MGRLNWYVAVVIALVFAGRLWAQTHEDPPRIDTPHLSVQQADNVYIPSPNTVIHDAIFAPDGKTIYLLISSQAIDLWALAVFYWPEEFCLLLGVILWFLGRLLWLRLVNVDDRQEARKKRRSTALLIHTVVILGAVGTYIVLALVQPPRVGSVSQWFDWDSKALADWAIDNEQTWLADNLDVMEPLMALEQIDFPTGRHLKQHRSWRRLSRNRQDGESEWIWWELAKSSKWKGGRQAYLIESDDAPLVAFYQLKRLYLFDCQRQQVVKSYPTHLPSWCRLMDINKAYGIDGNFQLKIIDLHTGDIQSVQYELNAQSKLQYDGKTITVMSIDRQGKRLGPAVLVGHTTATHLASTVDGRFVYAKVLDPQARQGILVWDTRTPQWIIRLNALNGESFRMASRDDGQGLLVLSGLGTVLKIYDLSDDLQAIE